MTSKDDDLAIELEAAPVVPLRHIASLEVLSAHASEAVRQLQAEERQRLRSDHPSTASALLDIASCLIEHGVHEQHRAFVDALIAKSSRDLVQALQVAWEAQKPREPWTFWTIKREILLLSFHDQAAQKANPKDLSKDSFYPRLRKLGPVVGEFLGVERYENKDGETIDDFTSSNAKRHNELHDKRTEFEKLADRMVQKHLRALLFARQSVALTDHLFGDLLGDLLGHLRPGFDAQVLS
ncbi:hypothetical protein FHS25_005186 [Rhizobium laguerreae]|uniref:AbiV family abortive infection protein n=1 Tax=Rhizobium laguerreae TaxID=1076926 RepID=A0ABR6GEI3_9HYPH|nr:hypothetical protein [Rhizobium laguerreae]MBB3164683.1 hypothetical protein [Rhizobium laguerreae]